MADEHDPHAPLHEQASGEHEDHEPALGEGEVGDDLETKLNALDKRLTQRINDLRKDNDTFKKNTSTSVQTLTNNLGTLKTDVENNTASIAAQDGVINEAGKRATEAKKSADEANTAVGALRAAYESHTHDVQISLNGETRPPKSMSGPGEQA